MKTDDSKKKVAAAAKLSGTTAPGIILEPIPEKADRETLQADFEALAEQRYPNIVITGKTISWTEMQTYLEERMADNLANHILRKSGGAERNEAPE